MNHLLSKSTLIVSSLTLFSRLLGFVRDMLIAHYFGVSAATDAFFVAFRFPNLLRRLFAEGSFAQAFVPLLSEYKSQNLPHIIGKISGHLVLWLSLLTLTGIIIAPLLIMIYAGGFEWQSQQHLLASRLLQIMLPYGLFITLVAFMGSILNVHSKFVIPALTPALLNLSMIGAMIWLSPYFSEPILALAVGVLIGGMVQCAFQIPALWRLNLVPRFQLDFNNIIVKRVMNHLLPTLFATSATQLNLLLNTFIASFLNMGSVSWLYYADRLLEFPLGILGTGLATVMLPKLAQSQREHDNKSFYATIDWGLRWVIVGGIPATIGLVFLSEPILRLLFQSEQFTILDVQASAECLESYAMGLIGFLMVKILTPVLITQNLHAVAVRYAWYSVAANLIFNLILIIPFAHQGIALATALSAMLNAVMLFIFVRKNKLVFT